MIYLKIISDDLFENLLTEKKIEKSAWLQIKAVCLKLLWNVKAENCKELVKDLLNAHQTVWYNVSLNIHYFTF